MARRMKWAELLNGNRRRSSSVKKNHRSQFERDYDRTIFSTPLKRLQDKAQVFPLERNDSVRTRLTHSLEVSSVARGLARRISSRLFEEKAIDNEQAGSIEVVAATCGLLHDLGNPPFGHAGEDAIREWAEELFEIEKSLQGALKDCGGKTDFTNFEGNAQSLRLVSRLQVLADFFGLNLTYGTLSASCKYTSPSSELSKENKAASKPGYFLSELETIEQIREATGTWSARNPITFIVEAADDMVYGAADVEDALRKKVVYWDEVYETFLKPDPELEEFWRAILGQPSPDRLSKMSTDSKGAAFRTAAISKLVDSSYECFFENYDQIMTGTYKHAITDTCKRKELVCKLSSFGRQRIYGAKPILVLELMGRRVLKDLLETFWQGAKSLKAGYKPSTKTFEDKALSLISENYLAVCLDALSSSTLPTDYHRLQLVTDFVCGMTDSYAKRLHADLFNGE